MTPQPLQLSGHGLSLPQAWRSAHREAGPVSITPEARERLRRAREVVDRLVDRGEVVYGVTTGFGRMRDVVIPTEELTTLQRNLIRSHAFGRGTPARDAVVRLLLLLRLNTLLRGHSGVREETASLLCEMLNRDVLPVVPEQGSVGASGDLAPLSHLALVVQGEGEARFEGRLLEGGEALARAGLVPRELGAKEGLALINGTQFSAAVGALALERAWSLSAVADIACALSIEGALGSSRPFDARVAALRPHPGHAEVARNVRTLLAGSGILESHRDCGRVQDGYSLRCVPQVHGAVRDALHHLTAIAEREINAVTDNPLVFPDDEEVLSAGNFHAEPLALPFDYATCAVHELASISERRIERLVNPDLSGLPPFLAGGRLGVNSGLMIGQVAAAALVSENKVLCHPASVDSIPTSAGQEDHVSMAPIAARHFEAVAANTAQVLAIELLAGFFALHHRRPLRSGPGLEAAVALIAERVAAPGEDRYFKEEVDALAEMIDSGALIAAVEDVVGPLARGPV